MGPSIIVAALGVGAACYAHYEIPLFTKGTVHRAVAHGALVLVGCACGLISVRIPGRAEPAWLAFIIAFGTVHAPAAAILFVKYVRGSGQS